MEEEKGFYKLEAGAKRSILLFATHLEAQEWSLTLENKDSFTFPHEGWRYFDTLEEACDHYEICKYEWGEILFPSEEEIDEEIV